MSKNSIFKFVLLAFVLGSMVGKTQVFAMEKSTNSIFVENTYYHDEDLLKCELKNGIDVSKNQGEIDWQKVKAAGVDFALIRVGARGYGSDGNLVEDAYYESNIENAEKAGVQLGAYIFSQAITEDEAIEEANYLLKRVAGHLITMPLVMDYEYNGNPGRLEAAKLTKAQRTSICLAFVNTIKKAGYKPMIYANYSMLTNDLDSKTLEKNCQIWIARYASKTGYEGSYEFWQYTKEGTVDGIDAPVDCNFWYKPTAQTAKPVSVADQLKQTTVLGFGKKAVSLNKISLKWSKNSLATGYEVYQSNSKNGKYKKVATCMGTNKTSATIKKLKSGKNYYFRVRGFRTESSAKVYSKDSKVIKVKTKKLKTKKKVWLYKKAKKKAKKVSTIKKGQVLNFYKSAGNWYQVSYKKGNKTLKGYILKSSTKLV